ARLPRWHLIAPFVSSGWLLLLQRPFLLPVGHVPQPHDATLTAAGQGLAVGTESYGVDNAGAGRDGDPRPAAGHVPDFDGPVVTGGGERLARGGEGDAGERPLVPLE